MLHKFRVVSFIVYIMKDKAPVKIVFYICINVLCQLKLNEIPAMSVIKAKQRVTPVLKQYPCKSLGQSFQYFVSTPPFLYNGISDVGVCVGVCRALPAVHRRGVYEPCQGDVCVVQHDQAPPPQAADPRPTPARARRETPP